LLPHWIQFGGQFRNRIESQDGLGYSPVNDAYDLTQLRLGVYLQPTSWLEIVGVAQDSRVFLNHHAATGPPYQNIWDIREAYAQIGSSTEGWFDLIGGREMLSFGDKRAIGPSDWLSMGRTFDTVRLDHHPGFKVSIFASRHCRQGRRHRSVWNLYQPHAFDPARDVRALRALASCSRQRSATGNGRPRGTERSNDGETIELENERNEVDILRRRMDASVLLIKALGGGWDVSKLPQISSLR